MLYCELLESYAGRKKKIVTQIDFSGFIAAVKNTETFPCTCFKMHTNYIFMIIWQQCTHADQNTYRYVQI